MITNHVPTDYLHMRTGYALILGIRYGDIPFFLFLECDGRSAIKPHTPTERKRIQGISKVVKSFSVESASTLSCPRP